MTTKMKRLSSHLQLILMLIWTSLRVSDGYSCPPGQHCRFEPAPPGHTPPCAQPGLTYCEHVDNYPEELIRHLFEAGQFDIRTLLVDETREDFSSTKKTEYPKDYDPNSSPHVDQTSLDFSEDYNKLNSRDNDIYSHKTALQPPSPADATPAPPYNINYQAANISKFGYHHSTPNYWQNEYENNYDKKAVRNGYSDFFDAPSFYPNFEPNEWFRGVASDVHYNPNEWNEEASAVRSRRQIEGSQSLCSTDVKYVIPQAALNKMGDWKFVASVPNNNMMQIMRSEVCQSKECSGLCTVKRGRTSRCEQKYVQKRMLALHPEGNNLYNDVFWMPGWCQCTFTPN